MQQCQAVAESCAHRNQDQHNSQGVNALLQAFPDALPVEPSVNKHGNNQGINNSNCCRFRSGKDTAYHTNHHDQHCQQSPDGLTDLFEEVYQRKWFPLGIVVLDRENIRANHQRNGQNRARQISRHKQCAYRHTARCCSVNNHVMAGRNQQPFTGRGNRNSCRKVRIIAFIHHHRNEDGTEGSSVRRSRAGNSPKEVGCNDIDHGKPTAHPADQ